MPKGVYVRKQKSAVVNMVNPVISKPGTVLANKQHVDVILTALAEKYEEKAARYRRAVRVLRGEEGDC